MWYVDHIEHHGILGQKWGVRHKNYPLGASEHTAAEKKSGWIKSLNDKRKKIKDQKEKAKNYQKSMNNLQDRENTLLLKGWEYSDSKDWVDKKVEKLSDKNNEKYKKKIDYYKNQSEALSNKISRVTNDLLENRKEINKFIDTLNNDPDIVYLVKGTTTTYGGKKYVNYGKELAEKYGKTPYRSSDGGVHSVSGSRYVVKAGTDRNKNKKKFTDPKRKQEKGHSFTSTYVYMY